MRSHLLFSSLKWFFYGLALQLVVQCKPAVRLVGTGVREAVAYYTTDDFVNVRKFDSHVHLNTTDSAYIVQARVDRMAFLDIVDDRPFGISMNEQEKIAVYQTKLFPQIVKYATTFSTNNFESPRWLDETLASLKRSLSNGAVAVKIWKNVGLGLKDRTGKFVMIDDPRLEPVLAFLEDNNIPLIAHLGEPKNAWLPLDQMTVNGDRNYFSQHPEYHMFLHPEFPSYDEQIRARDHMLEKHPRLRFIGAHLGSLEWSLEELAKRLDKFPNMAVDLARMSHLHLHAKEDWLKTMQFFITYQDRLLYATDPQVNDTRDTAALKKHAHESGIYNWKFFVTDEQMRDADVNGSFHGLKLPREVVDKIYRKNAERWLMIEV